MYSLAASTAGIGLVVLASPAEAKIVFTPANVKLVAGRSVLLDLNHDGINDFNLSNFYSSFRGAGSVDVFPYTKGNALLQGSKACKFSPSPAPLKAGAPIGPAQKFAGSATCMARAANYLTTGAAAKYSGGPWLGVAHHYLGLQFQINGQTHFGWARISVSHFPFIVRLTGYAYETVPNKTIIAGKTTDTEEVSVVPTSLRPATLGALAMGSSALSIWRRDEPAGRL